MSTLDVALRNTGLIYAIYAGIIVLYALLAPHLKRRELATLGLINYAGLLGLSVMIAVPAISPFQVHYLALFSGIFIEAFCAAAFLFAGLRVIQFLRSSAKTISDRQILLLLLIKLMFFAMNYIASDGQYGIFADDSRIDFLHISPLLSRTWYLEMIIDFVVLASIHLRCLSASCVRLYDAAAVLGIIFINMLTGSKGATFLLIATVMLFIYAASPHVFTLISKRAIARLIGAGAIVVCGYVYVLSEVHQVPLADQINLTLARFLLSADARIMAFDPNVTNYVLSQSHGPFLAELFRGPAKLLGFSVAEFPIGVYQYQAEFATTNYVGSTNQLSAMFVIYGGDFWLGEFMVVAVVVFLAYFLLCSTLRSKYSGVAWVSAASLYWLSNTLSQGFDAFLQLLPISVATVLLIRVLSPLRLGQLVSRRETGPLMESKT